jgi:superfamily I DNA/RNA helicase
VVIDQSKTPTFRGLFSLDQDTNRLQFLILKKLKPTGRGLVVVGDDAQAIYSFRAAQVRNIVDFSKQFKRVARILKLEQNYRSTQPILNACNAVINGGRGRFQKNLWSNRSVGPLPQLVSVRDEVGQAKFVCDEIAQAKRRGIPFREQAALIRTSQDGVALEVELMRRKIPFKKYGGVKFLETGHVRDLLSIFRWLENPRDRIAGSRVLKLISGIGASNAVKMLDVLDGRLSAKRMRKVAVPERSVSGLAALVRLFDDLERRRGCHCLSAAFSQRPSIQSFSVKWRWEASPSKRQDVNQHFALSDHWSNPPADMLS